MSIDEDFYSKFPSLNFNSKETQRSRRSRSEYDNYLEQMKSIKKIPIKKQITRVMGLPFDEDIQPHSNYSPSIVFSSEDRNQQECIEAARKKKIYQELLREQIIEQAAMKKQRSDKEKEDQMKLERILQKQLENIQIQNDHKSLSENEKDINENNKKKLKPSNNEIYRYFSQSAKIDSNLFNYRRHFTDVVDFEKQPQRDIPLHSQYLKKPRKSTSEEFDLNELPSTELHHVLCRKCRKKFILCKDCSEEEDKPINEDLPIKSNQQMVVVREPSTYPFSHDIDPSSVFFGETLEKLHKYNERKITDYMKNYGDLKKFRLKGKPENASINDKKPKRITVSPTNNEDLDEILNGAQYTVITQIGFAKKQLQMDKMKL